MSLKNKKVFALIPARKNSSGVKGKNIYKILGKPLVDFTIEAAINSKSIDQIFVSSDSEDILNHVAKLQNICPVKRPAKFSTHKSTAVDVVNHFLKNILESGILDKKEDFFIVYLQPTSPLRDSEAIDKSFKLMKKKNKDSLISVVENSFSPYKSFKLNKKGFVSSLFDQSLSNANRQDLPKTYRANGAIYIFKASEFKKLNGFPSNDSVPFIMNKIDSLDIDSYKDIEKLELELSKR